MQTLIGSVKPVVIPYCILTCCAAAQDITQTQTLIIPAGSVATNRTCFNLASVVINDEVVEMTETFALSLSPSSTSVSIGSATVQGSITDTDGK